MSEIPYVTVKNDSCESYEDRKSIFIGRARHITTEAEALDFIKQVKKQEIGARHNVYAFVIKDGAVRSTDDGEPSGSAGLPVLDVIRKSGVSDVCIVVTRYFGGILLGTGGLVRAYTNAAKLALDSAKIVTYSKFSVFSLLCSYSEYQRLLPFITAFGAKIDSTDFSDRVRICYAVDADQADTLTHKLVEATNGRLKPECSGYRYDTLT